MGTKRYKGKTGIKAGLVSILETGKSLLSLTDAWKVEADCGCGIDCCERILVLKDISTNAPMKLWFENGELKSGPVDESEEVS